MECNFSKQDLDIFKKSIVKTALRYFFALSVLIALGIYEADQLSGIEIFSMEFAVYAFFLCVFIFFTIRLLLDLILKKKIVLQRRCRIVDGPSGEIDSGYKQIEIEGACKIGLTEYNSAFNVDALNEHFQLFEISFSKYSKVLLSLEPR